MSKESEKLKFSFYFAVSATKLGDSDQIKFSTKIFVNSPKFSR